MRILYVLPDVPGLEDLATGYLRHVNLVEGLARQHDVWLMATVDRANGDVAAPYMRSVERLLLFPGDSTRSSGGAERSRSPHGSGLSRALLKRRARHRALDRMRAALVRLVHDEPFDVMVADFQSIRAVPRIPSAPPLILDVCDAAPARFRASLRYAEATELPRRLWRYAEAARWQRRILTRTPHLVFISSRDRDLAKAPAHSTVIPNGVDTAFWRRSPEVPFETPVQPRRLVFHGVMSYPPNLDAALHLIEDVLPRIRMTHPAVELSVVGRDPPKRLHDAGERAGGVAVTGFVPDVRTWLQASDVYVAPLRFASGMQNKLLEAMAMGLPAVTTSIAAEGCRVAGDPAPPLVVADGTEVFARAVATLLEARSARFRLARDGRRHVTRHCTWQRSVGMLEDLCRTAAEPITRLPSHLGAQLIRRSS